MTCLGSLDSRKHPESFNCHRLACHCCRIHTISQAKTQTFTTHPTGILLVFVVYLMKKHKSNDCFVIYVLYQFNAIDRILYGRLNLNWHRNGLYHDYELVEELKPSHFQEVLNFCLYAPLPPGSARLDMLSCTGLWLI